MKDIVILFDTACMYEVVILNYFLKAVGAEVCFCSIDGSGITAMEGYSINVDASISDISVAEIRSIIIPGGDVAAIKNDRIFTLLREAQKAGKVLAAICAGVDVLEEAGVLEGIISTKSDRLDFARDQHIITARANAYVDFAIEAGKELDIFEDEADLQETIAFWKYHKRMD